MIRFCQHTVKFKHIIHTFFTYACLDFLLLRSQLNLTRSYIFGLLYYHPPPWQCEWVCYVLHNLCHPRTIYNTIQLAFDIALLPMVAPSSEVHTPRRCRSNYIAEQLCAKDVLTVPTVKPPRTRVEPVLCALQIKCCNQSVTVPHDMSWFMKQTRVWYTFYGLYYISCLLYLCACNGEVCFCICLNFFILYCFSCCYIFNIISEFSNP